MAYETVWADFFLLRSYWRFRDSTNISIHIFLKVWNFKKLLLINRSFVSYSMLTWQEKVLHRLNPKPIFIWKTKKSLAPSLILEEICNIIQPFSTFKVIKFVARRLFYPSVLKNSKMFGTHCKLFIITAYVLTLDWSHIMVLSPFS